MATLRIPPVLDGAGDLVQATISIRLITADGVSAIGFVATELVTEYERVTLPLAGLSLTLTAQATIAAANNLATYYLIEARTAHRVEAWSIQMLDQAPTQELSDRVGAVSIDPADIANLPPSGGTTGQVLGKQTDTDFDYDWITLSGTAADVDQYEICARLTVGTGPYVGYGPAELTEEASPAALDFLIGWLADGTLVKYDIGNLPGGSGSVDTSGTPVALDFARFTDADTIEGRSYAEVKADLSLEDADINTLVNARIAALQASGDLPPDPSTLAEGDMIAVNVSNKYAKVG